MTNCNQCAFKYKERSPQWISQTNPAIWSKKSREGGSQLWAVFYTGGIRGLILLGICHNALKWQNKEMFKRYQRINVETHLPSEWNFEQVIGKLSFNLDWNILQKNQYLVGGANPGDFRKHIIKTNFMKHWSDSPLTNLLLKTRKLWEFCGRPL